ncbi:hypothetical protein [Frondihabitans sp. VKM Ac-2883]|uniref:hypothetical protein n=1 Tax=Frondihabitans sp. VKM Ac-2883 TaxID=2783823 RepID=UPI00188AC5A3|nr:hypothetical protein [Frondihabitans sp. VKM Ac-2883]MBF4577504.1 hypothetical protein [Frondihabitans sp. VKM Ac-2883]
MNPGDILCYSNPICAGGKAVGAVAGQAASNGFKQAAETMFASYDDIMKQFLTSWTTSGFLVALDNKATAWFQDTSLPITIALLTLGLVVAGARVMYSRRGEPFQEVMSALGRAVAVITLGTAAIQIFVWGGDAYAQWILKQSGVTAAGGYTVAGFAAASPGLALIFGLIGVMAVGFQWVIMFVRQALMLLLNAFWQISASYALLKRGEQAFEKVTAWIIAFIIYTPLAASIYAFAWRLKDGEDGVGGVLYGLMLIILAVVALPAIMRLLVPASGALGSAIGGAMALGVGAAALQAGVAVGAAVATGGASAGAGAGTGTASTTSTATTSTSVAEGSELASAGGGLGADGSPTAEGGSGDAAGGSRSGSDGAAGMVGGGSASGADGNDGSNGSSGASAAGGASESGSGPSSSSRAGWAAAGAAADSSEGAANTAEGMIE